MTTYSLSHLEWERARVRVSSSDPHLNPLPRNEGEEARWNRDKEATMARKIRVMSGDSHLDFPPERWVHRVPGKWRDRAPRRIKLASGDDAFIIENRRPHSP